MMISPPNTPFRTSKNHHLVPGEASHDGTLRFHSGRSGSGLAPIKNLPRMIAVYGFRAVDMTGTIMSKVSFVISYFSSTCTASKRVDLELEAMRTF